MNMLRELIPYPDEMQHLPDVIFDLVRLREFSPRLSIPIYSRLTISPPILCRSNKYAHNFYSETFEIVCFYVIFMLIRLITPQDAARADGGASS